MLNAAHVNIPQSTSFGSFKLFGTKKAIPEHLYHITRENSWQGIQKTKSLNPSPEFIGKGVFMFDMGNMLKQWTRWAECIDNYPVDRLLNFVKDPFQNLVLLKINTKDLKQGNFVFRKIEQYYKTLDKHNLGFGNFNLNPSVVKNDEDLLHLTKGKDIKLANKVSKNEPIEYIYKGSIPVKSVSQIGALGKNTPIDDTVEHEDIWAEFLKGTKEAAMIKDIPADLG